MNLNEDQLKAAPTTEGYVRGIAGAGTPTGKDDSVPGTKNVPQNP